ncbi:MAG: hypothetical protein KDB23_33110, partial [Planctomycetales bacterium]|nr:hypothetical protein [Planctomycetales bacterium]
MSRNSSRRFCRNRFSGFLAQGETLEQRAMLAGNGLSVDVNSYAADRVIVEFVSPAAKAQYVGVASSQFESLPIVPNLFLMDLHQGASVGQAITALRNNPLIRMAEPDYSVHLDLTPTDPSFSTTWGLHNTGQLGGTADADIDAPEAWEVSTGTGETIVAVIDSGIDYNHPDLVDNIWVNQAEIPGNGIDDDLNGFIDDIHGYDFVNEDGDPMDDNDHGT